MKNLFTPRGFAPVSILIGGLILGVLGPSGCQKKTSVDPKILENDTTTTMDVDLRCEKWMGSALDMLRPDRLGIDADSSTAVGLLNQWISRCADTQTMGAKRNPQAEKLLSGILPEESMKHVTDLRYVREDGGHVRNGILFKGMVDYVLQPAETELDRVVQLFNFVNRNVALVKDGDDLIPFTPYAIMFFGKGTAKDRAWIFANLLRQLSIPAVVLEPPPSEDSSKEASASNSSWLVGVVLDEEVYLFDSYLGMPVPSKTDDGTSITISRPASLSEVMENPGLIRQFDRDESHPYQLAAEEIPLLKPKIIARATVFLPRMKLLQESLAGDRSFSIYEDLVDDELGPGLVTRIAAAGATRWTADDVSIWKYPESHIRGFYNRSDLENEHLRRLLTPFEAPVKMSINKEGQLQIGRPQREQFKTRSAQLIGKIAEAVRSYQVIRTFGNIPPQLPVPLDTRRMHAWAVEDATFYGSICKYEQNEFRSAAESFRTYLERYAKGKWKFNCRRMFALSLARSGQLKEAIQALEAAEESDHQRHEYQLLMRRWRKILAIGGGDSPPPK